MPHPRVNSERPGTTNKSLPPPLPPTRNTWATGRSGATVSGAAGTEGRRTPGHGRPPVLRGVVAPPVPGGPPGRRDDATTCLRTCVEGPGTTGPAGRRLGGRGVEGVPLRLPLPGGADQSGPGVTGRSPAATGQVGPHHPRRPPDDPLACLCSFGHVLGTVMGPRGKEEEV